MAIAVVRRKAKTLQARRCNAKVLPSRNASLANQIAQGAPGSKPRLDSCFPNNAVDGRW